MTNQVENWYLVLELEFDPPEENEQLIADRIEERRKFWSRSANDPNKGAQYRTWMGRVKQMQLEMIGANHKRAQLAADACNIVYPPIDRLIKTSSRKGHLTVGEIARIAKAEKVQNALVERRAAALGIKVETTDPNAQYQTLYDNYYKTKLPERVFYDGLRSELNALGVNDLYHFLLGDANKSQRNGNSSSTLRTLSDTKKQKYLTAKPSSTTTSGTRLCAACEKVFRDDDSRKAYDDYLSFMNRKAVLDEAKTIAGITGEIDDVQGNDFINKLTELLGRTLAVDLFRAFCQIEKLVYLAPTNRSANQNLKVCRCGCTNDVSDGRTVCSACGLELVIKCPKCGSPNDNGTKHCSCGFPFANIDKALALCLHAQNAIEEFEFVAAEKHLQEAKKQWPSCPKIEPLEEKCAQDQARVQSKLVQMRSALVGKRFHEAKNAYDTIRKSFPNYRDELLEEQCNAAIEAAQENIALAKKEKDAAKALEYCKQAYDRCADFPGIRDVLPQPPMVAGLTIVADKESKCNILKWNGTADRTIQYVLVRSKNAWIQRFEDGEVVYRGSASSYADDTIEAGMIYYYTVFAERLGVLSRAEAGVSAYNLFDISNVSVVAGNSALTIHWDAKPKLARVEIYEVLPTGTKLLATTDADNFAISGLINDMTYTYSLRLSYQMNGTKMDTKGVRVSGIPVSPPAPIETLRIKPLQGNVFEATWYQDGSEPVRLFASPDKPRHQLGDMVSLAVLENEMQSFPLKTLSQSSRERLKPGEKGALFQHEGGEALYVTAVVVKSGSGIFGSLARASRGEMVQVKEIRPVNGKMHIVLDFPAKATGVVVLYRFDRFPTDIEDREAVRKYANRKTYDLNSAVVVNSLEPKKYYVSVFMEYQHDGEKEYSGGTDYLFNHLPALKIDYAISVEKKFKFFGDKNVLLEFSSIQEAFELPAIDVMSAVGNMPVFKASATHFYSIPAQSVQGILQIRIPFPPGMEADTHIKAFLQDERDQELTQLRMVGNSKGKIN